MSKNIQQFFKYKSLQEVEDYLKNSNSDRNEFSDDIYILVCGHLKHIDDLITFYKGLKNTIFVVDETESREKISKLEDNKIDYIVAPTPKNSGFGNVNLQCNSSYLGLKEVQKRGGKVCVRMRSDQIILQLEKFLKEYNFSKVSTICFAKNTPRRNKLDNFEGWNKFFCYNKNIDKDLSLLGTDYILDYCISGPVQELISMFNFEEPLPFYAPAEHKILLNYYHQTNMDFDNSLSTLKSNFNTMIEFFIKNKISFLSIKQNYHDWTVAIPLQPDLYWW